MIVYLKGDIFNSPAQVLVNTVNTVGIMGKGVALEFKKRYPDMFKRYQKACEEKRLNIGDLILWKSKDKWVLLFPTKQHWRNPSKLEYIEAGLKRFASGWDKHNIESIAFPRLGCGNGGLKWEEVQPLMEKYLKPLPIKVYIYVDEYKESVPEHMDISGMENWFTYEPQSMGFIALKEILASRYSNGGKYRLKDGEEYTVMWKNDSLEIKNGEVHNISSEDLCMFWSLIRDIGVIQDSKLAVEFQAYSRFLLELFKFMGYLEPVVVSEDGRSFNASSNGYQYIKSTLQEFCV